ncbi:hypothetical protein L9F63_005598, partial [Diploptera punctata]
AYWLSEKPIGEMRKKVFSEFLTRWRDDHVFTHRSQISSPLNQQFISHTSSVIDFSQSQSRLTNCPELL